MLYYIRNPVKYCDQPETSLTINSQQFGFFGEVLTALVVWTLIFGIAVI